MVGHTGFLTFGRKILSKKESIDDSTEVL